jgi:hypothetical protein
MLQFTHYFERLASTPESSVLKLLREEGPQAGQVALSHDGERVVVGLDVEAHVSGTPGLVPRRSV